MSEYPEAKMTSEQQNASLGETYLELLKRLDEGIFVVKLYPCSFRHCLNKLIEQTVKLWMRGHG